MSDNSSKIILDLCASTGAWSRPYKEAGAYIAPLADNADHEEEGRALYTALAALRAQQSGGWIPCSERMPEDKKAALCITKNGYILTAKYELYYIDDAGKEYKCWNNWAEDRACKSDPDSGYWRKSATESITHWQPLPALPEPKEG